MSLHDDIMNLPHKLLDTQFADSYGRKLYAEGHRDARHAAAEMALQADARIEELLNALQEILSTHANDNFRPKAFYIAANAVDKELGKA